MQYVNTKEVTLWPIVTTFYQFCLTKSITNVVMPFTVTVQATYLFKTSCAHAHKLGGMNFLCNSVSETEHTSFL